jgi:hypothetical protein
MRTAEPRFGHAFAAAAVAADQDHHGRQHTPGPSPWHGLPGFSALITQPEDADDPADPA